MGGGPPRLSPPFATHATTSRYGPLFWTGVGVGWLGIAFGVLVAAHEAGATHPPRPRRGSSALALAHDLVLAPVALLVAWIVRRIAPWIGARSRAGRARDLGDRRPVRLSVRHAVRGAGRQPELPAAERRGRARPRDRARLGGGRAATRCAAARTAARRAVQADEDAAAPAGRAGPGTRAGESPAARACSGPPGSAAVVAAGLLAIRLTNQGGRWLQDHGHRMQVNAPPLTGNVEPTASAFAALAVAVGAAGVAGADVAAAPPRLAPVPVGRLRGRARVGRGPRRLGRCRRVHALGRLARRLPAPRSP